MSDAAALKALAHPLRISLLELLVLEGPQTASQAGSALDQTPANCSWHLRKLAEHGFVEEVPGVSGRSRPWRAVTEGLSWGEAEESEDPETSAAGQALTDVFLDREVQRLRTVRAAVSAEPPEWRDATSLNQSQTWLTADEARELSAAMVELFMSYTDRITDRDLRPEGSRLVSLVGWLVPSRPYRSEQ
ncbi:MAG: winged helix-turn-helix domain-containing protein [Nocardioides sp.]